MSDLAPADFARAYLQQRLELSPEQAAGAVRWMQSVESGLDPKAFNPSGGGQGALGIAQWRGSRQQALLARFGPNPSFQQQLQFAADELEGPEAVALAKIKAAATEPAAYAAFGSAYERPGVGGAIPSAFRNALTSAQAPAGALGPLPDFASIVSGLRTSDAGGGLLASGSTDLTPSSTSAAASVSPLALATLLAGGTHAAIRVSYDPFRAAQPVDSGSVRLPATPSVSVPRTSASATTVPAVNYVTRTGMRPYWQSARGLPLGEVGTMGAANV